jgi:hypothetical protein
MKKWTTPILTTMDIEMQTAASTEGSGDGPILS